MARKVDTYIKLQIPAGQANPSPPVGPALGQHGVNIMEFCKAFNAETQNMEQGMPIPVVISVYSDRSFTFITKTPPAAELLKKAAEVANATGCALSIHTSETRQEVADCHAAHGMYPIEYLDSIGSVVLF